MARRRWPSGNGPVNTSSPRRQFARLQRRGQRLVVYDPPARDVDQESALLHPAEHRCVEEVIGSGGQRAADRHVVCLGQEVREVAWRVESIDAHDRRTALESGGQDAHIEGGRALGDQPSDTAEPDDEQGLPGQLGRDLVVAPPAPFFRVAKHRRYLPGERQKERQGVIGHLRCRQAPGVRQNDWRAAPGKDRPPRRRWALAPSAAAGLRGRGRH